MWDFVTWISDDFQKHRIKSGKPNDVDSEREFDSGPDSGVLALTEKGSMFSHQFTSLNSYEYFCENHSGEVGKKTQRSSRQSEHGIIRLRRNVFRLLARLQYCSS
jgi:hypothetical protein